MEPFKKLPNEILAKIASYADSRSLLSFIDSDPSISERSEVILTTVKLEVLDDSLFDIFSRQGPRIQMLDLSYCSAECEVLERLIKHCKKLRELSIVNTRLTFRKTMALAETLVRLEKLSLTIRNSDVADVISFPANSSIKRVYVELTCRSSAFAFMARWVNSLENLVWLHLFIFGYGSQSEAETEEILDPIETLIISPGERYPHGYLTRLVHLFFPRLRTQKFDFDQLCYIESDGRRNSMESWEGEDVTVNNKPLFLESWIIDCDILAPPGRQLESRQLDCGLGKPRSLVIAKKDLSPRNLRLERSLATNLVELNLTFVHWFSYGADVYRMLVPMKSLKALALTSCTLMADLNGQQLDDSIAGVEVGRHCILSVIARSNLRELYVTGYSCVQQYGSNIQSCKMPLNDTDSDPTRGMEFAFRLEELTMFETHLPSLLLKKFASASLKCVRMSAPYMEPMFQRNDLTYFLQGCPSLEIFKLRDHEDFASESLWSALAVCRNMRELCIKRERIWDYDINSMASFVRRMKKLEVLHIASRDPIDDYIAYDFDVLPVHGIIQIRNLENGEIFIHEGDECSDSESDEVRYVATGHQFGRRAFHDKNFIGFLKPEGWLQH